MLRYSLAFLAGLCVAGPAAAASWADGMFDELAKDFGTVQHGIVLKHPFTITNNTGMPVHIANVHVSCGCVVPTLLQDYLAPGQGTALLAEMHSERFHGDKTVTIFVQFDEPRFEEVRITVRSNSRDDIVVTPETLDFGRVHRNIAVSASVNISLLGNSDWQVLDAISESNYVQTSLAELRRDRDQVVYQLTARLRPSLPAGDWYNDIWLKTNDPAIPAVRVPLTVEIEPALKVSPAGLVLGQVKIGAKVERKVVVRGAQPFRITAIRGADEQWSVQDTSPGSKPLHVLTVTLMTKKSGQRAHAFRILTDLKNEGPVAFTAYAEVVP